MNSQKHKLTIQDFTEIASTEDLRQVLSDKKISTFKPDRILAYEADLEKVQIELVKLQQWVLKNKKRVIIIFEGRDAAGKGGNIRRFTEHLNPRSVRQVALNKPTEIERGQWYFRRYVKHLPNQGEIVFFDRSWYNRAVVEPVMGFCNEKQYKQFIHKVPEFEHMLYEDGITIIKFWLSITKEEQLRRFDSRNRNPLKRWKFSPVDQKGQALWEKYSYYKEQMFSKTHTSYSPWIIVRTNDKMAARLECIRYVLSQFDYDDKKEAKLHLIPDPNVIVRYFRSSRHNND
ncbi:MAG: polyphosphate kinase 2 [Flavobacteriaceae bacterium]|nr:polyphosphate kinase 2 [Flavobacteriaceae bacterium]